MSPQEAARRQRQSAADKSRNSSMTLNEWCAYRRVSRSAFYKILKEGTAPKTYHVGANRYVSAEADAAWLAAREAEAAA